MKRQYVKILLFTVILISVLSSCVTSRKVNYMQKPGMGIPSYKDTVAFEEYRLKAGDRLIIRVYSLDEDMNKLYNSGSTNMSVNISSELHTYLVKPDGTVYLPRLENVDVAGKTLREVKYELSDLLTPYFMTTTKVDVDVRRVQRYYSIIGEGGSGRYSINREKLNVFQALAQAGNIGAYGDRSKIRIIRETEEGVKIITFDVRSEDIIHSEFYYIEDNDVIYVQPMTEKMFNITTIGSLFGTILSTVSFGYMLYATFK